MNEFADFRARLPAILRALAVGIPAGYLFAFLRTPIPWMIGPMVAVAALNLTGVRMHSPPFARQMGQVILGSAVALYFTPMVVAELAANLPAIVAATVAVFVVGGLGALTLSRASGVDGKSTFFASIPGGAMSMAVLAERYGAQVAPVAVAHSLRVSVVVIVIPFALTYGGIPLVASAYRPAIPLDILILVPWLAFGCVLGEVSERFRFHNGYLLMPIFFGAALTVSGIQLSAVPHGLTDFAQLMFGLVLGARYERAFFARHKLFIPFALLNSLFILLASVAAAAILAWAFDLPIATMVMATAPGGLAEMTIAAQALQISVPLVVAFHLFRVVMVNMGTQYIFTFASWALGDRSRRKKIPKLKRRMPMPRIRDPWDHHDWDSRKYVSQWAERQDQREVDREETFRLIAKVLPYDQEAPMNILDLGAGYGALAQYLLSHFSNATAVCQDGSEEMARLGRKRMEHLKGRFEYVFCDFSKRGWSRKIKGPFEAVVSSIAIHNVRSPDIIRAIYSETFALVKPGGCFLNFDRMTPSLKEQMKWLREAGFENVQCFRESGRRALVGGFKEHHRAQ